VPHHAVYPCASRSAAATLRSPRLPRVRDCGRGVCEAWGVEVTGGGRARGRARLVHRRRARSRRCASRLRWRRDGGARPRHLLGRGRAARSLGGVRDRGGARRGEVLAPGAAAPEEERGVPRGSGAAAERRTGEVCGQLRIGREAVPGRRRTAHLSWRGVTVVLPAEQSHGRTIVGDVALTVFLGVEI
jgi:hypothetical protein